MSVKVAVIDNKKWHGYAVQHIIYSLDRYAELHMLDISKRSFRECLEYCLLNNIEVVNMSIGVPYNEECYRLIQKLYDKGVTLIAAYGKGGFPGNCREVIDCGYIEMEIEVFPYYVKGSSFGSAVMTGMICKMKEWEK